MASINRPQTYPPVLPPCKPRTELANWTWADLGNPRPRSRSFKKEENYWQKQNKNTDSKTIERLGEAAEQKTAGEGDQDQSDMRDKIEERQGGSLYD